MNNKTRIIIGVVIVVLFLIGMVALGQTQINVTNADSTIITNQNNPQIQNNSTDTVEMESLTIVKYTLNKDKSSKVNTKPKSVITDKSSKVNTNSKNKSENLVPINSVDSVLINRSFINNTAVSGGYSYSDGKVIIRGPEKFSDGVGIFNEG